MARLILPAYMCNTSGRVKEVIANSLSQILPVSQCPPPPWLENTAAKYQNNMVVFTCIIGHHFSNGRKEATVKCQSGKWTPDELLGCKGLEKMYILWIGLVL